jgi:hypothetical protein
MWKFWCDISTKRTVAWEGWDVRVRSVGVCLELRALGVDMQRRNVVALLMSHPAD